MKRILFLVAVIIIQYFALSAQQIHTFTGGVDTAWVRQYGSKQVLKRYEPRAIALDLSGNVYVTGNGGNKIVTIKYSASGESLWSRIYNGSASALALDRDNDIIIAGNSENKSVVLKYHSNGDTLWTRRDLNGIATALAVDSGGNVYLTGFSGNDCITIKYNIQGELIWIGRYTVSGYVYNRASSLTVDAHGNVYVVTGIYYSDNAIIKYGPLGDTVWTRRLNGAGQTISADENGNVYVTFETILSFRGWDYECYVAAAKYNETGGIQWEKKLTDDSLWATGGFQYVDADANIYIASNIGSDEGLQHEIVKCSPAGDTLWLKHYGGSWITTLTGDASGNIFTAGGIGEHFAILKYSPQGDTLWTRRELNGFANALAVDSDGNVIVAGTSGGDYASIKYRSDGTLIWIQRYHMPPTSDDVATSFATDENGNTYISGYGGSHNITIKYDTHGDTVWTSRLNGFLYSASIASHASGNVYVAVNSGFFTGSSSIIKFNHAGDTLWVSKYPGDATFLKVDSSGNIYVTGRNIVAGTYTDVTTTKYTSSGETVWMLSYNGPGNSSDGGGILDIDKSGNVYVAASVYGSSGTYEYATIKYGPNGNFLWARNYRGNGRREDIPYAIAVDANENVYVTGSLSSSLMPQGDYGTLKYNSAGDLVWVRQYNGSYVNEEASALAIDGDGNVLVTGTSGSGFVTIKYNPSGEVLWLKRYESSEPDRVNVLILDAEGNVYLGGTSDHCFVVIKYDTMGNQQWIVQYSYAGGTSMLAGLGLDARNNVYIAGTSRLDDESFFTVIKYVQRPTSVKEVENAVPKNFALEQNYPNPFNPSTTIRYALPSSAHVKLTVYNLLGQRVCELVNEEQSAGWKEVRWNAKNFASGIYIVQMQCGSFTETKKILLVK